MSWTQVIFVSLLATVLILTLSSGTDGASVPDAAAAAAAGGKETKRGSDRRVFVPEADASTFFKSRGRRSTRYAELQAEQRVKKSAAARRRELLEERRQKYEEYAEEARDENNERSRETTEQWRQFSYDGQYPRYNWRN